MPNVFCRSRASLGSEQYATIVNDEFNDDNLIIIAYKRPTAKRVSQYRRV